MYQTLSSYNDSHYIKRCYQWILHLSPLSLFANAHPFYFLCFHFSSQITQDKFRSLISPKLRWTTQIAVLRPCSLPLLLCHPVPCLPYLPSKCFITVFCTFPSLTDGYACHLSSERCSGFTKKMSWRWFWLLFSLYHCCSLWYAISCHDTKALRAPELVILCHHMPLCLGS